MAVEYPEDEPNFMDSSSSRRGVKEEMELSPSRENGVHVPPWHPLRLAMSRV